MVYYKAMMMFYKLTFVLFLLRCSYVYGNKQCTYCFPLILNSTENTYYHYLQSLNVILKCSNNGTVRIKDMKYSIPLNDHNFCTGCAKYHCSDCPCCHMPKQLCSNTLRKIPKEIEENCSKSQPEGQCRFDVTMKQMNTTDMGCEGMDYNHYCKHGESNLCLSRWVHFEYECHGIGSYETTSSFNIPPVISNKHICAQNRKSPVIINNITTTTNLMMTDSVTNKEIYNYGISLNRMTAICSFILLCLVFIGSCIAIGFIIHVLLKQKRDINTTTNNELCHVAYEMKYRNSKIVSFQPFDNTQSIEIPLIPATLSGDGYFMKPQERSCPSGGLGSL